MKLNSIKNFDLNACTVNKIKTLTVASKFPPPPFTGNEIFKNKARSTQLNEMFSFMVKP